MLLFRYFSIFLIYFLIFYENFLYCQEKVSLLLDWKPNTNHAGFYVSKNIGKYKQNNIDLSIINPTESSVTTLIATGKAQYGVTYLNDFVQAVNAGMPLVAIAAIAQKDPSCFVWRTSAKINSVKDFEGKRYAGWGSPEEAATLKFIMKKKGADFSKLKILHVGINDFIITTQNNADFTWEFKFWGILSAQLRNIKVKMYCPEEDFPEFNKPAPILITNQKYLETHKNEVIKFLNMTEYGYTFSANHPKEASHLFMQELPELDKELVQKSMKGLSQFFIYDAAYWGYLNKNKIKNYVHWMLNEKLIEKDIDYNKNIVDWKSLK